MERERDFSPSSRTADTLDDGIYTAHTAHYVIASSVEELSTDDYTRVE